MQLRDKTALITGGGSGIGAGIAVALAGEGCKVAIVGRNEKKLHAVASSCKAEPPILCRRADVADRKSVGELFEWADAELGPIHILVNNAGINIQNRSISNIDPADWDRLLEVNATGAFNTILAVLPQMRERRDGLIVNISSIAGKRATALGGVAYNAAKFAMSALGTSVAGEEGKNGIRVTNIYPGEVNTPILDDRPVPVSDEHKAQILQPEDLAAAVLMIARLPPRAHISDMVIKPTTQDFY